MKNHNSSNNYNTLVNNAINLQNSGQFDQALNIYDTLLSQNPKDGRVLFLKGSLFGQMGEFEKCITSLKQSLAIYPEQADALNYLAFAYELSGQLPQALASYNNLLKLSPKHEDALLNKANILAKLGYEDLARETYSEALNTYPRNIMLLNNFSAFLQLEEEFSLAETLVKKALEIKPNYPQALSNFGNILIKQERFDEAEDILLKAISLRPNYVDALINLGFLCHNTARFEKALAYFNQAIELAPQSYDGHWYRAFSLLITGKLKQAWLDYDFGLLNEKRIVGNFQFPSFEQHNAEKPDIFVMAEQGVGDQVMFASCLPDLIAKCNSIVLECDKRLVPVFKKAFPSITPIATNQYDNASLRNTFPNITHKLAIGSLPRLFRSSVNDFPNVSPYLKPAPEEISKWKSRYSKLGAKLKVGISWQAGIKIEHNKRSMLLESWKQVLACDCDFISLQYGEHNTEIKEVEEKFGIKIHDWDDSDSMKDIDDFSAQIAALDLVISVGNTNVHLAGALNIPAWCLIPQVPSWRWMHDGEHCLWYPSVKIYRQHILHEWQPVLENVEQDLKQLILSNSH